MIAKPERLGGGYRYRHNKNPADAAMPFVPSFGWFKADEFWNTPSEHMLLLPWWALWSLARIKPSKAALRIVMSLLQGWWQDKKQVRPVPKIGSAWSRNKAVKNLVQSNVIAKKGRGKRAVLELLPFRSSGNVADSFRVMLEDQRLWDARISVIHARSTGFDSTSASVIEKGDVLLSNRRTGNWLAELVPGSRGQRLGYRLAKLLPMLTHPDALGRKVTLRYGHNMPDGVVSVFRKAKRRGSPYKLVTTIEMPIEPDEPLFDPTK